ncbi:MAG: hypothetical protein GKS07_09155 [Nitrosopumilus sp.]|nr:MAG: hypothetical protein GKS07_09155 [Nitrosopumilus sp.]
MKTKLLITGLDMVVFGLVNLFRYIPISLSLINRPFPFEHLYNVVPSEGQGTSIQIGYLPMNDIIYDPYWLVWSLVLYAGITVTSFAIWRKRK